MHLSWQVVALGQVLDALGDDLQAQGL